MCRKNLLESFDLTLLRLVLELRVFWAVTPLVQHINT
jgi:hypothetical protein